MSNSMEWVNTKEKEIEKAKEEGYFTIAEGDNRIQLLTHCAPLIQIFNNATKKYEVAKEGDKGGSVKGVCWVLHDGKVKQAKLPYTVVKAIKDLMQDPDYAFEEFPMPRLINIKAKNAGTKEVEYSTIPSPRETEVSAEVRAELSKKPTPEEIIEKIKGKTAPAPSPVEEEEIDPEDIPF